MISNAPQKLRMKVLMAHRACKTDSAAGRVLGELGEQLVEDGIEVLTAADTFDAIALIQSEPLIQSLLLDWDLEGDDHHSAMRVLAALRNRNHSMPVFLFTDRENAAQIPLSVLRQTNDFI